MSHGAGFPVATFSFFPSSVLTSFLSSPFVFLGEDFCIVFVGVNGSKILFKFLISQFNIQENLEEISNKIYELNKKELTAITL